MVYPDQYFSSDLGRNDIIDGNDLPVPFVVALIRQGSSDHLQPNFPTPGQIRSMFNSNKIGDCPEYASSPLTMSDPTEWRPNSHQLDQLEDRLLRIHQSGLNSFLRPYEGNNVTITDLSRSNENSLDDLAGYSGHNSEYSIRDQPESIRINLYSNDDLETQSQIKYTPSNETLKTDDQESSQREYDVEEYIDLLTSNDTIGSGSDLSIDDEIISNDDKVVEKDNALRLNEGIDREIYARIRQLEKLFKLDISENDNKFIKEIKTLLVKKIGDYVRLKGNNEMSSIDENIEDILEIVKETINDNDSVICDSVHDLCLKLKDMLSLKENIMSDEVLKYFISDCEIQSKKESDNIIPISTCNKQFEKEIHGHDENISTENSEEKFENDSLNEIIEPPDCDDIKTKPENKRYGEESIDSFESLITFSRIPVTKNSKPDSISNYTNPFKAIQSKDLKPQYSTRIPTFNTFSKTLSQNKKQKHSEFKPSEKNYPSKKFCVETSCQSSRPVKDILQQKEELLKKATILGLIDDEKHIARVPHLTERAHLALLEKQIQGKLKSKQLAMERKKTGLPERINKLQGINQNSKENNTLSPKSRTLKSPRSSNSDLFDTFQKQEVKESNKINTQDIESKQREVCTAVTKPKPKIYEESSMQTEISFKDDTNNLIMKDQQMVSSEINDLFNLQQNNESRGNTNILQENINFELETIQGIPVTSFIDPKDKLENYNDVNASLSHSVESVQQSHYKKTFKLMVQLILISGIIAFFGIALYCNQSKLYEMYGEYLHICIGWFNTFKNQDLKEKMYQQIEDIRKFIYDKLIKKNFNIL